MAIVVEKFDSGIYEKTTGYRYFIPHPINREWTWTDPSLSKLLERAAVALGALNSAAMIVPNIDLFLQLHVVKEAQISSKIEGTKTELDEALLPEDSISPERRDDWKEVNNYIRAIHQATEDLKTLPISSRLIRKTHGTLLDSVRGMHKQPGQYRRSQNWIGGATLADARFVPPIHTAVDALMSDLEHFLNNDNLQVPLLVRAGIAHYQFETIHPFLDGNGRIGRLLITLYLMKEGLLSMPLLYLSAYFEETRPLYYGNLNAVRTHGEMMQWLKYFLVGVAHTAEAGSHSLRQALQLKQEAEHLIFEKLGKRASTGRVLLLHLCHQPVVSATDVAKACEVSLTTAGKLIDQFVSLGILEEMTGQHRNRWYAWQHYLRAFQPQVLPAQATA